MNATALMGRLKNLGVHLIPEGDRLRWRAPKGVLTPELKNAITAHKLELLKSITQDQAPVMTRVRGQGRIGVSADVDICWHCKGNLTCKCALCGHGMGCDRKVGECGACLGTGYLTWSDTVH